MKTNKFEFLHVMSVKTRLFLQPVFILFWLGLGQAIGQAQITKVGQVAWDFELTNRQTGQPLKLSDYAGNVVVLDFFAWWCGPCRSSTPDLEKKVNQYFNQRDGNRYGVPVAVIAVNTEASYPDRTDQFIKASGLKLSADDPLGEAYGQFDEEGYIPLFVIINGVPGNSDYKQWEVIYKNVGYEGSTAFQKIINKVKLGKLKQSVPKFIIQPKSVYVEGLSEVVFRGVAGGWPLPEYRWFRNGMPLMGETNDRLILEMAWADDVGEYWVVAKNKNGETRSDVVQLNLNRAEDPDLNEALDLNEAIFASGSTFKWVRQTEVTSDGEDALLMTGLPDWSSEVKYAELKTRVEGPGELTFKAKIEGELQIFRAFLGTGSIWGGDFVTVRDTAMDWKEYEIGVPDGLHTLTFMFLQGPKNGGNDSSLWLDDVKIILSEKPHPGTSLKFIRLVDGVFKVKFDAIHKKAYQLQHSENLTDWQLYRELKPDQVEADMEILIIPESTGRFYRLKSD